MTMTPALFTAEEIERTRIRIPEPRLWVVVGYCGRTATWRQRGPWFTSEREALEFIEADRAKGPARATAELRAYRIGGGP